MTTSGVVFVVWHLLVVICGSDVDSGAPPPSS
eukprot:CAMPEP_0201937864 /NCGR_PEP_ID=MMETSP0903-20130614/40308_1 /ASSEMBLY_ACC=CAM_ASM_000552 /TAXON_ID=420261 /ORGANISM="Thalassiosira antarctica, Strain CCMP982" /LENGTH=31 /DNA_ID= /DNA_START= /DNA_END= /DNA_ORIENTATION=